MRIGITIQNNITFPIDPPITLKGIHDLLCENFMGKPITDETKLQFDTFKKSLVKLIISSGQAEKALTEYINIFKIGDI